MAARHRAWAVVAALLGVAVTAGAEDGPLVTVTPESVTPARIEIQVGEVVTWKARRGERVRVEMDPHPDGHEVIERPGEVQATFLKPGEHWYSGTITGTGTRVLRGVVVVREVPDFAPPLTCGPESSQRVCFAP